MIRRSSDETRGNRSPPNGHGKPLSFIEPHNRKYLQGSGKNKAGKVQLIIEQAKNSLIVPFPTPDFMMLTCFTQMTEHEKQSLSPEFKAHLEEHIGQLPALRQQIEQRLSEDKERQGESSEGEGWTEGGASDLQLEIAYRYFNFQHHCRELQAIHLKILQTNDFIRY